MPRKLKQKTAIVDKQWLGGVCLNVGCIPSKSLLKNAEVAHTLRERGKDFGFSFDNLKLDYGVAVKRSRQNSDRLTKSMIRTIGPVWDGNEVWLLVAGGATFAAFPGWYATLFSGFYLALFLILVALIVRGVAIEYRNKRGGAKWRTRLDVVIAIGSFLPALLWGVAFANIVAGVPINADGTSPAASSRCSIRSGYAAASRRCSCSSPTASSSSPSRPTGISANARRGWSPRWGSSRRSSRSPSSPGRTSRAATRSRWWSRPRGARVGAGLVAASSAARDGRSSRRRSRSAWRGQPLRCALPGRHAVDGPRIPPTASRHERRLDAVHPHDHDDRGRDLRPGGADLPDVDLPRLPQAGHGLARPSFPDRRRRRPSA